MSTAISVLPKIRSIEFLNRSIMFVHLANDRTFLVPIDEFPPIKELSMEQREAFEIIDDEHLSFVSIDEVYSVADLIGVV